MYLGTLVTLDTAENFMNFINNYFLSVKNSPSHLIKQYVFGIGLPKCMNHNYNKKKKKLF